MSYKEFSHKHVEKVSKVIRDQLPLPLGWLKRHWNNSGAHPRTFKHPTELSDESKKAFFVLNICHSCNTGAGTPGILWISLSFSNCDKSLRLAHHLYRKWSVIILNQGVTKMLESSAAFCSSSFNSISETYQQRLTSLAFGSRLTSFCTKNT